MIGNPAVIALFMLLPAFFGYILTTIFLEPGIPVTAAIVAGLFIGYCAYTFGFMAQQAVDRKDLTDLLSVQGSKKVVSCQ